MSDVKTSISDVRQVWHDKLKAVLQNYVSLYQLPTLSNSEEISREFYNYCLRGKFFVVVALYNSRRDFFIQKSFAKRHEGWELVGGWAHEGESFDQALDRIVHNEAGDILVEAVPVARVKNVYRTEGGLETSHEGVAFLGRLLHDDAQTERGVFCSNAATLLQPSDKAIFDHCQAILRKKVVEPPLEEVYSHLVNGLLGFIHQRIVKPISYLGSSRILQNIIFQEATRGMRDSERTVIDVACGDDQTVVRLAARSRLVVANDISREAMKGLISQARSANMLFTNQNFLELHFASRFDVVICKNVMHHLRAPQELEQLLSVLKKLGTRIIIMDIENPRKGFLAKLWNYYYRSFLHDRGSFFIRFDKFVEIIQAAFSATHTVQCKTVRTIKGRYMLAVMDLKEVREGV